MFPESELIINPDGSVYHLNILPEDVADTIITVGDPDRVEMVTKHFDSIEIKKHKREFCTHTGHLNGKRLTVISTGIGTDNIDIVFNELDALVNIDFKTRTEKEQHTSLKIARIGTSGAFQPDIDVDTFVVTEMAVGLDNLLHFYKHNYTQQETELIDLIKAETALPAYAAHQTLDFELNCDNWQKGITLTCPGFYAPQGRELRGKAIKPNYLAQFQDIKYKNLRCTNFEMETAGIYGLARILGHRAVSCSAILANRANNIFSKTPQQTTEKLIKLVLEQLTSTK